MRSSVLRVVVLLGAASLGSSQLDGLAASSAVSLDALQDDTSSLALFQTAKTLTLAAGASGGAPGRDRPRASAAQVLTGMPAMRKAMRNSLFISGGGMDRATGRRLIDEQTKIFGATRDTWKLWGITIFGFMFLMLTARLSVDYTVRCKVPDVTVNFDKRGSIVKPVAKPSFVQRVLFRADLNPRFAYNADLAMRVAIMCALCSLTYFIPELNFINHYGFTMQSVVNMIIFTVNKDLGSTVSVARNNIAGTAMPVINIMIMYGFFPEGSTGTPESGGGLYSTVWWCGFANFMVFQLILLSLKWPPGIRMFGVSWNAYFSMCFLDPGNDTHFGNLTSVVLTGEAAGPLMGTVIGSVLAVLPLCFWPLGSTLSCLSKSQDQALRVAWEEGHLWNRMVKYFKGNEKTLLIDKLIGECDELHQLLQEFTDNTGSNAWWECYDTGRPGRVRLYMLELCEKTNYMNDWLRSCVFAMKCEDFGPAHDTLMLAIGSQLEMLADKTALLLYRSTIAAVDGGVAPFGRITSEQLDQDIRNVFEAQRELTLAFVAARREQYGCDNITEDAVSEHFFVYAISVYGQYVTEFAEILRDGEVQKPKIGLFASFFDTLRDMLNFNGWAFAIRGSIGFFLAYYAGWRGIPGMLTAYNSNVAGTTAVLMASDGAAGSAVMKNIARFQGTAGGTIVGQLLWGTLVSCSWRGSALGMLAVLMLEFFSMFLFFSSPSYGYVGVLLGGFGAKHLLLDCDDTSGNDQVDIYHVIEEQMLAILCVTIGDLMVGNSSPGLTATKMYHDVTEVISKGFLDFFCLGRQREILLHETKKPSPPAFFHCTDVEDIAFHRGTILRHLSEARVVGNEAPLEPRWTRTPWRTALWQELLRSSSSMGNSLAIMEYAISRGNAAAEEVRRALITSPSMNRLGRDMLHRTDFLFLVAKKVMTHEDEGSFGVSKGLVNKVRKEQLLELTPEYTTKIINEVVSKVEAYPATSFLTQDAGCQLGVVILCVQSFMRSSNMLENAIFSQKELLSSSLK